MEMHPIAQPRATTSHGERRLFEALAKVDRQAVAFHSLRLRTRDGWEGEGDFVIADPAQGLLVLEVKGGALELRDGHWFQNGKPLDKSPRTQALGFVKRLTDELRAACGEAPPFGVACVFPDCEFSKAPTAGDLREVVLGKRDLAYLKESLDVVFKAALPEGYRLPKTRKWVDALKTLWGDSWVPTVQLADRAADAAERVALDAKQYQLLEFAGETPRALVEGAAGTGKTLVAAELCRRRAAKGHRTQYLCFTDALAKAVQRQFGATPGLHATSVRQLAVDLLRQHGAEIPPPDKKFWDEVSFAAAVDALPPEDARPDLLVIDEGQDFEANDWMLVEQLIGPRSLWIFRDPRQAYWEERRLPDELDKTLGGRFTLPRSYRCPEPLTGFAEQYVNTLAPRVTPSPEHLRLVTCDEGAAADRVRHELETLLKNGAKPEQIAIITLSGQTRSQLFKATKLGSVTVTHADAPEAGRSVVVETFLRFKGLERPFVIISELGGSHVTHYATRMHIALTRATVQAIVVASATEQVADEHLFAFK